MREHLLEQLDRDYQKLREQLTDPTHGEDVVKFIATTLGSSLVSHDCMLEGFKDYSPSLRALMEKAYRSLSTLTQEEMLKLLALPKDDQ